MPGGWEKSLKVEARYLSIVEPPFKPWDDVGMFFGVKSMRFDPKIPFSDSDQRTVMEGIS